MYKKHKIPLFYAYSFQNIRYFCATLRIIIQKDEEKSQ